MGVQKIGDWKLAQRILATSKRDFDRAIAKTLLQEALFYKKQIVQGIRKQAPGGKAFKPISKNTRTVRRALGFRGTKALIRNGDLLRSIQVVRRRNGVFIGIPRTVSDKQGRKIADLARIHEEGSRPIVIRVTPKMRRFLFATLGGGAGGGSGGDGRTGIVVIKIPARPFLAPVLARWGKPSSAVPRVTKRMAKNLQFKYGKAP